MSEDGHIVVCVRVRDVPSTQMADTPLPDTPVVAMSPAVSTPKLGKKTTSNGGYTPSATAAPPQPDQRSICVSALENVVVMHDPRSVSDTASIARDASTLIQAFKNREDGGTDPLPTARYLNPSSLTHAVPGGCGSASYYECDECVVSMTAQNARLMPIIRDSDFLQPPPYGKQEDVYQCTAAKAVDAALEGINSCVFAYGQTGSGKTYTLFGDTSCLANDPGVVLRALDDLFRRLEARKVDADTGCDSAIEYTFRVSLSFFEIYQADVTCLLSKRGPLKVVVSDSAPVIQDLEIRSITNFHQGLSLIEVGLRRRQTGETGMNAKSSRSHAIVQIAVQQFRTNKRTKETVEFNSLINLVDLAGSERQRTAKTEGKSRTEGIQINQSLATLARVINEVSRGAKHVAYRDSMLTTILKENLGGNSKTFMIATINPTVFAYSESCATLQYARDVRRIRNRPKINRTFQTRGHLQDINSKLKEENASLRAQIEQLMMTASAGGGGENANTTTNGEEGESDEEDSNAYAMSVATGPHFKSLTEPSEGRATGGHLTPVLLSVKRVYDMRSAVPVSRVEGRVNVTPLCDESAIQLNMASFFAPSFQVPLPNLIFECITQRTMERSYWLRVEHDEKREDQDRSEVCVDVEVNGKEAVHNDPHPLHHGDVITVTRDVSDSTGTTQERFVIHFVDLNAAARREEGESFTRSSSITRTKGTTSSPTAPVDSSSRLALLEKEMSKLLDVIAQQARTIEYQCQRDNARVMKQLQTRESSPESSVATIASPDIRNQSFKSKQNEHEGDRESAVFEGTILQRDFDAARDSQPTEVITGSLSPSTAEVSRASSVAVTALAVSRACSASRGEDLSLVARYDAALEENRALQLRLAECQETINTVEMDNARLAFRLERVMEDVTATANGGHVAGESVTPRAYPPVPRTPRPTALGESPMRQLSTSRRPAFEGEPSAMELRERLIASKRERTLKEAIAKLEYQLDESHQQVRSLERMMEDMSSEHSIVLHEAQSDAAELSRALFAATAEYDNVMCQLHSLQDLARRSEEALTEANINAEVEFERRLTLMSAKIEAVSKLCRIWKCRAIDAQTKHLLACKQRSGATPPPEYPSVVEASRIGIQHAMESNARIAAFPAVEAEVALTLRNIESDGSAEVVDVLKENINELQAENIMLQDQVSQLGGDLEQHRRHVHELVQERARMEREKNFVDDKMKVKAQTALKKKSEELLAAEKLRDELQAKLELALQSKQRLQKSVQTANDMLKDEQRKNSQTLQQEVARLLVTVSQRDDELSAMRSLLNNYNSESNGEHGNHEGHFSRAKQRLEVVLEQQQQVQKQNKHTFIRTASVYPCAFGGGDQYTAFPKQFVFTDEAVTLTRVCLRMLMDRMKVELYVMNKATAQAVAAILPTVQYRPDAVFQSCMTDLRRIVAASCKCVQRIGCAWILPDDGVEGMTRCLSDTDRRSVHKALLGLLLWYDHWDLVSKRDHASCVELIRNSDLLLSCARLTRMESSTPTNSIYSSLSDDTLNASKRPNSDGEGAFSASGSEPETAQFVKEGRKILANLQRIQNSSVLVQQLKSPVKNMLMATSKGSAVTAAQSADGGNVGTVQTSSYASSSVTSGATTVSPEATPPPTLGLSMPFHPQEVCRQLDVRSTSSATSPGATARHHLPSDPTSTEEERKPNRNVAPMTNMEVDTAIKFTRQHSAAVFSVRPDELFPSKKERQRSMSQGATSQLQQPEGTGNTDGQRPIMNVVEVPSFDKAKKKLSHMTEEEIVSMVLKDKKKIFNAATAGAGAHQSKGDGASALNNMAKQQALLSFFRTMSPPKTKISSTLPITSPQQDMAGAAASSKQIVPKLQLSRLHKTLTTK